MTANLPRVFDVTYVCIVAVSFFAFSLYFSLGPAHKFKELKKNKLATLCIALGMFASLFVIFIESNLLIFHRPWGGFLTAAFLVSALVSAALKIGCYKTPIQGPGDSRRSDVASHENIRRVQDDAEIREVRGRHNKYDCPKSPKYEYPFTSPEETELAIKRWETS